MKWKQYKEQKELNENRFNNVDLGTNSAMQRMIMQARRNASETLQELVDTKQLDPNMTVADAIAFLRG